MRRIAAHLTFVTVLVISAAAHAAHTAPELHVFFGTPIVNPATLPTAVDDHLGDGLTDNPETMVAPGDIVCLPIMVRMVGNAFQDLRYIAVELFGTGNVASFSHAGNTAFDIYNGISIGSWGGGGPGNGLPPFAPTANTPPGTGIGQAGIQMMAPMYSVRNTASLTTQFDVSDGIQLLGYLNLRVEPHALSGNTLELRFSNSNTVTHQNIWGIFGSAFQTIAYGWDPNNVEGDGDGLNSHRLQNSMADVLLGTTNGQQSTLRDARLTVIPEPCTLGLLGLCLLVFRLRA